MHFEWIAAGLVVLAIVLVVVSVFIMFRESWFMQWIRGTLGLGLLTIAIFLCLIAINVFSYKSLTQEAAVATVSFVELAPQQYQASVATISGEEHKLDLAGDLWQIDARVLKWRGIFALMGGERGYQLDRIQGRYLSLEDERRKPRTIHSLAGGNFLLDIWSWAQAGSFLLDAKFGSAAYLPMAHGAVFEVTQSNSGLIARPVNGAAEQALSNWH